MNITCHLICLCVVDKQFENVSGLLLNCTTDMLNKYRQLLLSESQVSQSISYLHFFMKDVYRQCLEFFGKLINFKDLLHQKKLKPLNNKQELNAATLNPWQT